MGEFIIQIIIGLIIIIIGILNMKGNISLLHSYHRKRVKKEDIIINYENGYLTIKATKTVSLKVEAYIRRERFYGEVKRSFYIGEKKESDIKANYESGILTITFPKEDILKNEKQNIIIK